jgi:hypothetical protein
MSNGLVGREQERGIFPKQHVAQQEAFDLDSSVGVLRTMTQLIVDLSEVCGRGHSVYRQKLRF